MKFKGINLMSSSTKTTEITVEQLNAESKSALSIFTTTLAKLKGVNTKIEQQEKLRSTKVAQLQRELQDLSDRRTINTNVCNQIEQILAPTKNIK